MYDYSMYTEKCHLECHSQFIKCELCDVSHPGKELINQNIPPSNNFHP